MKTICKGFFLILLVGFSLYCIYQAEHLIKIISLRSHNPKYTAMMKFNEKDRLQQIHRQWSDYSSISGQIKKAVLAAEDAKFMVHDGFDFEAIEAALKKI